MENRFFPLFVDLNGKDALVVGAGKIALRKVKTLLEYGANVKVVTKEIREEEFFNLKNIDIKIGEFDETLLENIFIVVAGTDNPEVNKKIFDICNRKNILVNNITSKTEMNCRFASILETPEYQIAISAKGNPSKSKNLKDKLKNLI